MATDPSPNRDRFYDGMTAASRPAAVALVGDAIEIRAPDGALLERWSLTVIRTLDENEVDGSMTFSSTDVEGARLVLYPSPARDALLSAKPRLRHWRRHSGFLELRTVAIWSGVMIAIVVAGYFGWRPLAGTIAPMVPPVWEERIGETIRSALVHDMRSCTGEEGIDALTKLAARIAPDGLEGAPITIDVVRTGQPNAIALPGNHIVVFEGLLTNAESPEMVAGVLAHEIGHLDLDHPTRRIIEQLGLGFVVSIAFGGTGAGEAGLVLASLSYSREAEAEADVRAIQLLEAAGIRSDGLARFFRKLVHDETLELPDWLSTHPDLEARAAANPGGSAGDAGFDPAQWSAVRAICGRNDKDE